MSLVYLGQGNPSTLYALDADGGVLEKLEVVDWDEFDIGFL